MRDEVGYMPDFQGVAFPCCNLSTAGLLAAVDFCSRISLLRAIFICLL